MTSSDGNIFRATGHLCGEFTGSPVNSPHKGQWRGALMFTLICARINGWVNNREAGDLTRYRAHYDVIVMLLERSWQHETCLPICVLPACVWMDSHDIEGEAYYNVRSNASVTSNHGPRTILAPVRFLARKAEWSARRNFTLVLFSWSHQATGPVRFHTAVHIWCDRMNRRTPHGPRAMPVRASHGPRTGISYLFNNLQGPYGARARPARVPYDTFTYTYGKWHNQKLQKSNKGLGCSRTGPVWAPCGPVRAVHGLFMISKPVQGP